MQNDIPRISLDVIDQEILSFFKDWASEKDLYQWYKNRYLPNGYGLAPQDKALVSHLLTNVGTDRAVIEIGAAAAQCSMALALNGVRVFPIEMEASNFGMQEQLGKRLAARLDPTLPERLTSVRGFYPEAVLPYAEPGCVLLFPSLSTTLSDKQFAAAMNCMRLADYLYVGLRAMFVPRDTPEEQRALVDLIKSHGFDEPETVMKWDSWSFGFYPDHLVMLRKSRR